MGSRSYATIQCSIWEDGDFLALSPEAKTTYFMLVTQPDIEACGSLALTVRRWARFVSGGDRALLVGWLNELAQARFVITDPDTEELLVRTFAKYDGGYRHAVRCKAVVSSARAIRSERVRAAAVEELARLGVPVESHTPARNPAVESLSSATQVPPESLSSASRVALESQRSVVTLGEYRSTPHSALRKGEGVAPESDLDPPPPWCSRHPGGTDAPCQACRRARERADQAAQAGADRERDQKRAALQAKAEAIDHCRLCNEYGARLAPDGTPGGPCNHQPKEATP